VHPREGPTDIAPRPDEEARVTAEAATLASDTIPASGPARLRTDVPLTRGAAVGRYVVLAKLGSGGMGVVYTATDPELERTIALKVLRAGAGPGDGIRLLREARALARLAHPNIVAVHDVGTIGDATSAELFIAMEFVEGATVRAWLDHQHSFREILDVFLAAGRGLAAAHRAGLVHRDFKPDNVMIGSDGRARVMDFGLARASESAAVTRPDTAASTDPGALQLTRDGSLLGTPMYMAPEQWEGRTADARTDQFAFCVALWEAVHAARPFRGATMAELMTAVTHGRIDPPADTRAPAWISRVLRRGLATRPEDRYPTMDALLAALERGAARRRRRPILLALAALALVVAVLLGLRAQRSHACTLAGAAIADVWNDERAAALRAALLATDLPYAEASHAKAVPLITAWTADWSAARAQVCRDATINNTVSSDMYTQSAACLDEAKDGLAALLEVFVADSAAHVDRLVPSAAELPQLSACTDPAALARRPAPPDAAQQQVHALRRELLRERGRLSAGNYARTAEAAALLADAEALAYPPLVLAARALVAELARHNDDYAAAEAALRRVYLEAEVLGADEIAVTAAADLLGVIGRDRSRAAEALQWSLPAEVILQRIHQDRGLLGAHLFANRAVVLRSRGDLPEALEDMQRALEIREAVLGPDHPLIASTLNALGSVHRSRNALGDALAVQTRALAIRRAALGAGHPAIGVAANDLGLLEQSRGQYAAAATHLDEALKIAEGARDDREVGLVLNNLGRLAQLRGDLPAAQRLLERALASREANLGPHHLDTAATLHNLGLLHLLRGDRLAARAALDRVLKIRERQLGDTHPELITTLVDLGTVNYRIGDYPAAQTLHERALELQRRRLPPGHRDLASSLRNLALVHDARGDTSHAFTLASEAVALGETALGHDHPEMATLLNTLGMLQRRRDPAAAEATLSRALAITVRARGGRHPAAATSLVRLGEVYLDRRTFNKAQASLDEALSIRETIGDDTPEVAEVLVVLGDLALAQNDPPAALPLLERALQIRSQGGIPRRQLADARFALARALRAAAADAPRSRELAQQAADAYQADAAATELAAVHAWLKAHK
jgi:tetratricopeptide (TPR) repeat protein